MTIREIVRETLPKLRTLPYEKAEKLYEQILLQIVRESIKMGLKRIIKETDEHEDNP